MDPRLAEPGEVPADGGLEAKVEPLLAERGGTAPGIGTGAGRRGAGAECSAVRRGEVMGGITGLSGVGGGGVGAEGE